MLAMAISRTPPKPACCIGVIKIAIASKPAPTQSRTTHIPCGSWLASDGNLQNTIKTRLLHRRIQNRHRQQAGSYAIADNTHHLWELACQRWQSPEHNQTRLLHRRIQNRHRRQAGSYAIADNTHPLWELACQRWQSPKHHQNPPAASAYSKSPSPASRLLRNRGPHTSPVGAGLPAMAISRTPSKRASCIGVFKIAIASKPAPTQLRTTHIPCGSWLASDGNLQSTTKARLLHRRY